VRVFAFAGNPGRAVAVPLMAAGLVTGLAPAAGAAAVPCVSMAGQQPPAGRLEGVAVLSPCSAWAVGDHGIVRWDGATWTAPSLPAAPGDPFFHGVRAFTASDIWAVGHSHVGGGAPDQTLIEHYDGSRWTVSQESRPAGSADDQLFGVTATSPTSAWAVGASLSNGSGVRTEKIIEHWNGSVWTRLPKVPTTSGEDDVLGGVAAISAASAWAVGYTIDPGGRLTHGLMLRWDGTKWAQVTIQANVDVLTSVAAVSANDAWAVGYNGPSLDSTPVILHWDGSSWRPAATPPAVNGRLIAVTATSASNAWAVGDALGTSSSTGIAMHWDGTAWTAVPLPAGVAQLRGVAASTADTAWAVGHDTAAPSTHAIALCLRVG
jgi:hypothetical protein